MSSGLILPASYRKKEASFADNTFTYLENKEGHIIIPLDESGARRAGYQRYDIPMGNIREVERVSRRYEAQKQREFMVADAAFVARAEARFAKIRSQLHTNRTNAKTQFERDFITLALKRLEERENQLKCRKVEGLLHCEHTEAPLRK